MSDELFHIQSEVNRLRVRLRFTCLLATLIIAGVGIGLLSAFTQSDARPIGVSVMLAPSGKNIIVYRLWSHGGIDRRLVTPADDLTFQGGWKSIPEKYP